MIFLQYFSPYILPSIVFFTFLFLYLPMVIIVVFSFNNAAFPYQWVGFSLRWYQELFQSHEILEAFKNSLIVACSASLLSLTLGALFIFFSSHNKLRNTIPLFFGSILIPEIVVAVGLLSLFTLFSIPLGLTTLIASHTILGLGYVIPILSIRFAEIDNSIIEASLDLGASIMQTFFKIILPLLMPALIASGLLVFIISFDDFLISFFCAGTDAQTLPLYIFAMIRTGVSPTINALSTLLLLLSSLFVLIFGSLKTKTRIF